MFLAASVVFGHLPFGQWIISLLFPICALLLSFRRSVHLYLLAEFIALLESAFRTEFFTFWFLLGLTLCMIPGGLVGTWVFKRTQKSSIAWALLLDGVSTIVVSGLVILVPLILVCIYLGPITIDLTSSSSPLAEWLRNSPSVPISPQPSSELASLMTIVAFISLFGAPLFLVLCFWAECKILKEIQRRLRGLPASFPT
jgi:hypothetical protein